MHYQSTKETFRYQMYCQKDICSILFRTIPAFKLADAGYEVWLGNDRGTSYSLKHVEYDWEYELKYWDFRYVQQRI